MQSDDVEKNIEKEPHKDNPFLVGQLFGDGEILMDPNTEVPEDKKYWFICNTEAFTKSWLEIAKENFVTHFYRTSPVR